ncbi:hypothetical protein ISS86_02475 [Candidatus Microgenomates bacterium]|nr:hypothetical protein [Candidatus Microgenomates bacterium]
MAEKLLKNKKLLIILAVVLVLSIAAIIIFKSKQKTGIDTPLDSPTVESSSVAKLTVWDDPAGFSFSYPEEIEIDPHSEDEENYAHLELILSSEPGGRIIIWVKESDFTDIEDWAEATAGGQIFDTELDAEPAKKIAYSEPTKLVTAAIDVDALVLIEMIPDKKGYWQKVYDKILSSFKFIPLEGEETAPVQAEPAEPASANIIEEAEEMIE